MMIFSAMRKSRDMIVWLRMLGALGLAPVLIVRKRVISNAISKGAFAH